MLKKALMQEKKRQAQSWRVFKKSLSFYLPSFSFDFLIKNKFLMMKTPGGGHNQKMQMNSRAGRRRAAQSLERENLSRTQHKNSRKLFGSQRTARFCLRRACSASFDISGVLTSINRERTVLIKRITKRKLRGSRRCARVLKMTDTMRAALTALRRGILFIARPGIHNILR